MMDPADAYIAGNPPKRDVTTLHCIVGNIDALLNYTFN